MARAAGTLHSDSRKASGILGNNCIGSSWRQGFLSGATWANSIGHGSSTEPRIGAAKLSWKPLVSRDGSAPCTHPERWALVCTWARAAWPRLMLLSKTALLFRMPSSSLGGSASGLLPFLVSFLDCFSSMNRFFFFFFFKALLTPSAPGVKHVTALCWCFS